MNRSFDSGLTAAEDSSLNRIRRIVGHSLAVNDAQWTHFMRTTGQLKAALAWINNTKPTTSLLFYVLMPNATLQAAAFLPVKGNFSKTTFFIKTTATPVSSANFDDVVIHADMPANLIEFTATAMQSIYAPLLCNPPTRLNWPPETCTDVDAGLQKISRQMHDVVSERRSHRRRQHVKFELNASICWSTVAAAVQTFSRSRGDNFEMHNVVEQAVIALCIDLEAALRASEPVVVVADSGFIGINDECSRWQERWCFMRSMNDTLRGVNAAVVSEMLGAFGSVAYLRSFETILQMVETQSVHVIGVVSFMRALANQLRSIQTASLEDMLNMVGPIVHCWSKMCSQEFATSGVFVPSDAIRVIRSVCDEFMLEIRRTLDLGGGMWQQVQAQDVQKFHCAEQILQRLRQAVIAKIQQHLGSEQPAKSGALQRLRRFAQRLQQIRGVLEAALDYRNIGYLAIICGGTQVSSGQLLQLVDVHRGLLVNYSIQSAADLWDIDGDCVGFEKCTNAHRVSVCDLNETVIQAFDAVVVNCRTAEHCKQLIDLIENLQNEHLRNQLQQQWLARFQHLLKQEIDELASVTNCFLATRSVVFEPTADSNRVNGHLNYPSASTSLLTIRALQARWLLVQDMDGGVSKDASTIQTSLDGLATFETDIVQQFLVAFQHFERVRPAEMLLNLLIIRRLNVHPNAQEIESHLRDTLNQHRPIA